MSTSLSLLELIRQKRIVWPSRANYAAQDDDGYICFYMNRPLYNSDHSEWAGDYVEGSMVLVDQLCQDHTHSVVSINQWINFSDAPIWADRVVVGPLTKDLYWASSDRIQDFQYSVAETTDIHVDESWEVIAIELNNKWAFVSLVEG